MKTFIRTITLFVALNVALANSAPAANNLEEKTPQVRPAVLLAAQAPAAQSVPASPKVVPEPLEPPVLPTPGPMTSLPVSRLGTSWPGRYGASGAVLVIPSAQMKAEDLVAIMEDLNVMSRIFDKKLGRTSDSPFSISSRAGNIVRVLSGDSDPTEAIYLGGFGAMFLIKVDFLLSPLPEVQEEQAEDEDVDQVWMQTKQEIYMPEEARKSRGDRPTEEYNAEKVEDLKRTLTHSLRHAANIRNLKPDEWVTVVVRSAATGMVISSSFSGPEEPSTNVRYGRRLPRETASYWSTFLTVRAKKSDIDAFSKDKLDYEQFRQRMQMFTY